MKRPLAVIGAVFAITAAAAVFLGRDMFPVLFAVFIIAAGISLVIRKLRRKVYVPAAMLTAAAAVISVSVYTSLKVAPTEVCQGQTVHINAELCELPYEQYGKFYYKLNAASVVTENGDTVNDVRITVSSRKDLELEPYDRIEADVDIFKDSSLSSVTKGYMLSGTVDTEKTIVVTKTSDKPIYYYALQARKGISEKISEFLPEKEASFITAFLTGDKTSVPEEMRSDLSRAGISHIIAVSGFHISLLSGLVMQFFTVLFRKNKRIAAGISIIAVLSYMAIAGFSPSVLRAGIIQMIMLSGILLFRKSDSLNSLGLAVLLITFCNPYSAADISLILSASASFGILFWSPKMERRIRKAIFPKKSRYNRLKRKSRKHFRIQALLKSFIKVFSVSFSAYLMTLPAVILWFRKVPTYSVITNILISPAVPVMVAAVIFILVLSFLPWLASPFAFVTGCITDYILAAAGAISSLPFSVINVSQEFVPYWLAAVMLLALVLFLLRNRIFRVRIFAITAVITFVAGTVLTEFADRDIVRIAVLDSGDGLSVVITENHESAVLFCGGDHGVSDPVSGCLDSTMTGSVRLLLLTDSNNKSSIYASHILRDYNVETAVVYDSEIYPDSVRSLLDTSGCCIEHSINEGQIKEVHIGDKTVKSLVTWTNRCVYLDLHGFTVLICTDKTNCEYVPKSWLETDLLIVNGMPRNSYLLKYKTLIVSDCTENKDKYKKLSDCESVYNTFSGGDVILRLDSNNEVVTRRESHWLS